MPFAPLATGVSQFGHVCIYAYWNTYSNSLIKILALSVYLCVCLSGSNLLQLLISIQMSCSYCWKQLWSRGRPFLATLFDVRQSANTMQGFSSVKRARTAQWSHKLSLISNGDRKSCLKDNHSSRHLLIFRSKRSSETSKASGCKICSKSWREDLHVGSCRIGTSYIR